MSNLKIGNGGPHVVRLQEHLDALGFDGGENDGMFGTDTEQCVKNFQTSRALKPDGIVGPITSRAIMEALDAISLIPSRVTTLDSVVDERGKHEPPKLFGRKREWSDITGVTLHQTGCKMSRSPGGWHRLNAHIGITSLGQVVIVNDPTDMIWHAQGLSHHTIGIEIAGNFHGVEGDDRTLWHGGGPAAYLTEPMLDALDVCFEWLLEEFAKHDRIWRVVHAHRQSSAARRGDPGSEIWHHVGLVWIERLRELMPRAKEGEIDGDGGPGYHLKKGRPIPLEWDPERTSSY